MEKASASPRSLPSGLPLLAAPLPRSYLNFIGRKLFRLVETLHGLLAFSLITLGVTLTQFNRSAWVMHPLIRAQVFRAGVSSLPMTTFLATALGFVIIGQTLSLLQQVGAQHLIGTVMVTVVVRELGPLIAALVVLVRVGTATVIELGTARAMGEVEALEALGIDPIHYLVVPRVLGLAISIFSLTVYLILGTLFSGYVFAFLQDVPLRPAAYLQQLGLALYWQDFVLLALKTISFGAIVAIVTCYEGLAKPLQLEEIASATTRAVVGCVISWVLLDALFILVYLMI